MNRLLILLLIFFNLPLSVFSQINSIDELVKKYNSYFELDRETIYTHLNKTRYVKGEEIWFKSYIYNNKYQIPYESSTNIYVSLFNESGNLITSKLVYAANGFANGNFEIDNKFTPGIYFIKTSTNWMKNFKEDLSYVQKLEIIGNNQEETREMSNGSKYDLQLLPEGGHIVQNVSNTIGFKLINNQGNGIIIKEGIVLDENNNIITTFKSNQFGLGRFTLHVNNGTKYNVSVVLANGKKIIKPIGFAERKGISFRTEATNSDNVLISLETNEATLPDLIDKPYRLLIHRDGKIIKIKIDFVPDQLKYLVSVKKSELLSGINIFTLINENFQPIAERLIFNNLKVPIEEIEAAEIISKKDSSIIILKTNIKTEISSSSFSISVLPSLTEAYMNQSTIVTTFLLTSYIKGNIENPYYYFSAINRRKLYDLDLLLLNQGWSKYSWDVIFKGPPKVNHTFETGFQIKGSLNNYKQKIGDLMVLSSPENQIHETAIIENKVFSFKNLFLADSTSINFSLKNKKGKLIKPLVYYNIYPKSVKDNLQNLSTYSKNKFYNNQRTEKKTFSINHMETTLLNTVVLKASPKSKKTKKKPLIKVYGAKHINLTKSDFQQNFITSVIRDNGFDVVTSIDNVKIVTRRNVPGGTNIPSVFIDNVRLFGDFKSLVNLRVSEVEDMYISTTPNAGESPAGSIKIFTRNGKGITSKNEYQTNGNLFGFSMPKEYYVPKYLNTNSDEFLKLGAIHWIPNLTPNEKGELIFKLPNYTFDAINIYIEGMSKGGSLWSKRESINLVK